MSKPKKNLKGEEYRQCSVCGEYGWFEPGETECCLCVYGYDEDLVVREVRGD